MPPVIKQLGLQPYEQTWQAMQSFTAKRTVDTPDEIWLVQHPPVFTQGLNGKAEHLLKTHPEIPLIQTDRGGQVTYHGPGQLVVYLMIDLKRVKFGAKEFVQRIENAIISLLDEEYHLKAEARRDAPGVYIDNKKIASLGLKIKHFRSYHGVALNVDMDLTPFQWINPCGLVGMSMAQLADYTNKVDLELLQKQILKHLLKQLEHSPDQPFTS